MPRTLKRTRLWEPASEWKLDVVLPFLGLFKVTEIHD